MNALTLHCVLSIRTCYLPLSRDSQIRTVQLFKTITLRLAFRGALCYHIPNAVGNTLQYTFPPARCGTSRGRLRNSVLCCTAARRPSGISPLLRDDAHRPSTRTKCRSLGVGFAPREAVPAAAQSADADWKSMACARACDSGPNDCKVNRKTNANCTISLYTHTYVYTYIYKCYNNVVIKIYEIYIFK